jgi:acetyltransferase-like isoleucine patch superfamily enzyme
MPLNKDELRTRLTAISMPSDARLLTDVDILALVEKSNIVHGGETESLARLGITLQGNPDCTFCVLKPGVKVGNWKIVNNGMNTLMVVGEPHSSATTSIQARILASDCTLIFPDMRTSSIWLADVHMRSPRQTLFWGAHASAVHAQIEIQGEDTGVLVGDDCMFSSGVWIRNHDMHAIFDISTSELLNNNATSTIIEQHVWISQAVLILSAKHIGYGSIVGANSLVNAPLGREMLAVGSPAKVIRSGVSWSRSANKIEPHDLERLRHLRSIAGQQF